MSALSCEPPAMTDLLKLGALVPTTKLPAPKVSHVLEQVFELCQTDWIYDFLFTEDPIHMNHLTSSSLFNTSFVSELSTTRVESPTSQPNPYSIYGESHFLHGRLLFVPTFTAGHITVGFGVVVHTAGLLCFPGYLGEGRPNYYNSRFVRDANQKKLLVVLDLPKEDRVSIYYSNHNHSTSCHSATVDFCRSSWLSSIKASKAHLIPNAISALRDVTEESYFRQCPVCGSHHAANCGCSSSNVAPAHPYDLHHFKTELVETFGTFEGLASKSLTILSGTETTISFGARVSIRLINDNDLKHRLRAWSICEHLNSLDEDARKSLAMAVDGVNNIEPSSSAMETDDFMGSKFSTSLFGHNQFGNVTGATSDDFLSTTDIVGGPPASNGKIQHSPFTAETQCADHLNEFEIVKNTAPVDLCIGRQLGYFDEWGNQFSPVTVSNMQDMGAVQARIHAGACNLERLSASAPAEPHANEAVSPTVLQRPSTTEIEVGMIDLERRRILEARRERNRASARRSNTKNKELRAAIRRELKTLNGKFEVLRERELQLRRENLALRKLSREQKRLVKKPRIDN